MENITDKRNRLWDEFEKRTEHLYGADLAEELDRFAQSIDDLEREYREKN